MINMHLFTIYATQRRAFSQCSSSRAPPKVGDTDDDELPFSINALLSTFSSLFSIALSPLEASPPIPALKLKLAMFLPSDWSPPCGKCCTKKYSSLLQIPWRVFCKKGCGNDAETWEECVEQCEGICYKDPVLKDQQWSAYIDRSPGDENYSRDSSVFSETH
ncbi:hypothetical protein IHE45_01G052000 [Dioscorea alata]|uniref:Uncharacterized protein n=2 Tax=Dioscorea alata TaxID=55571 RepID=A0ACB7WUZ4_DIOAL|nr:hypothetical protein IHE45_01G052000 [Dioscorea alata]KAH7692238.1 hypothetical protein IHE45_01G052000 [Dioscorea alata]